MLELPYPFLVNELDVLQELIRDPERNWHFNEIVPYNFDEGDTPGGDGSANDHNLTQLPPFTESQYPNVYMTTTDINPVSFGNSKYKGCLTDEFTLTVTFEISIRRNQVVEYGGITYHKSTKALRAIYDILNIILFSNIEYKKDLTLAGRSGSLVIKDVRAITVGLRPGKEHSPDAIDTLVSAFQFDMEKNYTYSPLITRP